MSISSAEAMLRFRGFGPVILRRRTWRSPRVQALALFNSMNAPAHEVHSGPQRHRRKTKELARIFRQKNDSPLSVPGSLLFKDMRTKPGAAAKPARGCLLFSGDCRPKAAGGNYPCGIERGSPGTDKCNGRSLRYPGQTAHPWGPVQGNEPRDVTHMQNFFLVRPPTQDYCLMREAQKAALLRTRPSSGFRDSIGSWHRSRAPHT